MQSGTAKTHDWVLEYEPEQPRAVEPLMGWTSSGDMRSQVRLSFATKEEAVAYCERHGIPYQLSEPKEPVRRTISYSDNFAMDGAAPGRIDSRDLRSPVGADCASREAAKGYFALSTGTPRRGWHRCSRRAGRIRLRA